MGFTIATKTLKAIESGLQSDQGALFRTILGKVLPYSKDAYRGEDSPFRSHLGASVIGSECARQIWYGFRWSTRPNFKGRVLRLFNRGHLEEARFISLLLMIGCVVYSQDDHGNQFRISDCGGHFGGSGDGVANGIPDIPEGHYALLEFKTHNDKSFKKLKAEGVRASKFEHFVQMQTYMRKMGFAYALYMAVNKNDDELHAEIITIQTEIGDRFIDRARQIIFMRDPPKKINESPGWFACSWCDHKPVCHLRNNPDRNCRTCNYSIPGQDGLWYCGNSSPMKALSEQDQLKGCVRYSPASSFGK